MGTRTCSPRSALLAMTPDLPKPPETGVGADAPRLTWHDKEVLTALRRLASARLQVQSIEAELAASEAAPGPDPLDAGQVERLQDEIDRLSKKANGRFGRAAAREKLVELRRDQQTLLTNLGYESYEAFSRAGGLLAPTDRVDPVFVDFARRELASAEAAWEEVARLPEQPPYVPEDADGEPGDVDPFAGVPDFPIDLTHPEAG